MKSLVSCMNHDICDIRNFHTEFNIANIFIHMYYSKLSTYYHSQIVQLNFRYNAEVQD